MYNSSGAKRLSLYYTSWHFWALQIHTPSFTCLSCSISSSLFILFLFSIFSQQHTTNLFITTQKPKSSVFPLPPDTLYLWNLVILLCHLLLKFLLPYIYSYGNNCVPRFAVMFRVSSAWAKNIKAQILFTKTPLLSAPWVNL